MGTGIRPIAGQRTGHDLPIPYGSSVMSILTTRPRALRGWHRPLVANAALMFTLALVFAVAGVLDVGAVAFAAANGTFSHFNQNTDPVARTVQTVFSFGIFPLLLTSLIISILTLFQRIGDRTLTRALRAGLGLAVASMVVALW